MSREGWCPQHGNPTPCYKCGYEEENWHSVGYKVGYQAGLEEVVWWVTQWIKDNNIKTDFGTALEWQAQLEEWGIHDGKEERG